jgi:N utilization substance protein B
MQSFKGREKARRYAMQALYGWLLSNNELKDIEAFCLADRNPKNYDVAYFLRLLHDIPANLREIDEDLIPYLDRPFNTLDPIELTILRVAGYELKYSFDVPFRVVLHEAVELAKMFGSDDSYKFTNSVLDKMAKQLRPEEIFKDQKAC